MSDHLPECPTPITSDRSDCICPALRACEQRVTRSKERVIQEADYNYRRGVQGARDAVAALTICNCDTDWESGEHQDWCVVPLVLAAIDALKGERA